MELAPFLERRCYSQSTNLHEQSNIQDSSRKDTFLHGYEDVGAQVSHWQADSSKYSCNTNASSHCLHRHTAASSSMPTDAQHHAALWHPYTYSQEAYSVSRPEDAATYEDTKAPLLRSSYHSRQRETLTAMSSGSYFQRDTGEPMYRSVRNGGDFAPNQFAYHSTNSLVDTAHDVRRDWGVPFMKGPQYGE